MSRRSYLRLLGASATASAVGAAASGTAGAAEYTEIVVGAGETRSFSVGTGETFENYLIDITASGANVHISATGTDWIIRNVGIKGLCDEGMNYPRKKLTPKVDAGGTGLIENVYLGDGSNDGRQGAMWVEDDHAGELIIRNCNVQGWADNGIYGSGPGVPTQANGNGAVKIENCYAKNNNVSNFRIGTPNSYVKDSVVHVDGDVPNYGDTGAENSRGIWAWYDDNMQVQRTDILIEHGDGTAAIETRDGGVVYYSDSDYAGGSLDDDDGAIYTDNVGSNPDVTIPSGVPTSATDAANGGSSGGGGGSDSGFEDLANTITISGSDASYRFGVTGRLEHGASQNPEDVIAKNGTASGAVAGASDTYQFEGSTTFLALTDNAGDATVTVNGTAKDPSTFDQLPNTISIAGGSSSDVTSYQFAVSGQIEPVNANPEDSIDGGVAEGEVAGYRDEYRFSGNVTYFQTDGSPDVTVNGSAADPATLGDSLANALEVSGGSTDNAVWYRFGTDGAIEHGATKNTEEVVYESDAAYGGVAGAADSFNYSGNITYFHTLDPNESVTVTRNGSQVDPSTLPSLPNTFEVRGGSSSDSVSYKLSVSGQLEGEAINSDDELWDDNADGVLWGGSDVYYYSGSIDYFAANGSVTTYVNGQEVDPSTL